MLHSRIFRRFLISYLLILIMPIIAGYLSYRTSISVATSISIENSVTELQKSEDTLERRMAEVEGFTRQLALNPDLINLTSENPSDSKDIYGIWRLMKQLTAFSQTNDLLQNVFIYLNNYNVIVMPGTTYYQPELYYQTSHYKDVSFAQWKKNVLGKAHNNEISPLRPYLNNGVRTSAISFLQSLPMDGSLSRPYATVEVIIDERSISNLLSGLQEKYGGWVYVQGSQGQTISSVNVGEPEIRSMLADPRFDQDRESQFYGNDLVISVSSKLNGWTYIAGIPRSILMKSANRIKFITWSVTGGTLLLGILAGLFLYYRNFAPIIRFVDLMQGQFGKENARIRNEFDFLHGNISAILKSNKQLKNELTRQIPVIRDAFLKRLLAGAFQSRDEIVAAEAQANLRLGDDSCVGILQINGYTGMDSVEIQNELSAARFLVKKELADLDETMPMTDSGSDRVIAVFDQSLLDADDRTRDEMVEAVLKKLAAAAFEKYKITFTASLGNWVRSALELNRSYEQAKQTSEFAAYSNRKGIMRFHDLPSDGTTYYYPLEDELKLISTIRSGRFAESAQIVASILTENRTHRVLSAEIKHQLIGEFQGTFMKLLDQRIFQEAEQFVHLKELIADLQLGEELEEVQSRIEAVMQALCSIVNGKRNDLHMNMIDHIKQFVEDSYMDPELTLYRIAEQVERPEKYISQLFKEITGVNLSAYLEKIRLDHAAELLGARDKTVDEIASLVGYNSSHSFRRAFKRVMGISPSSYRESLR